MIIHIKVIVNSKKSEVTSDTNDLFGNRTMRIKVNQPPEDGKANKEVIKLLAQYFKTGMRNVEIISGRTYQHKTIKIITE